MSRSDFSSGGFIIRHTMHVPRGARPWQVAGQRAAAANAWWLAVRTRRI